MWKVGNMRRWRSAARFGANATNDPLVGTQEHPDQIVEQVNTPDDEAAAWPVASGPAAKSRIVAGVLGIFLGFLGAHRFYLGYVKIGAMQLSLFLLGFAIAASYGLPAGWSMTDVLNVGINAGAIVWFWGLAEGVMILGGMMHHDARARPLR